MIDFIITLHQITIISLEDLFEEVLFLRARLISAKFYAMLSTRRSCFISHPVTSSMKRVYRVSTLPTYIITISVDLFTFTRFIHSGARTSPMKAGGNSLSIAKHLSAPRNRSNNNRKSRMAFLFICANFLGKKKLGTERKNRGEIFGAL